MSPCVKQFCRRYLIYYHYIIIILILQNKIQRLKQLKQPAQDHT